MGCLHPGLSPPCDMPHLVCPSHLTPWLLVPPGGERPFWLGGLPHLRSELPGARHNWLRWRGAGCQELVLGGLTELPPSGCHAHFLLQNLQGPSGLTHLTSGSLQSHRWVWGEADVTSSANSNHTGRRLFAWEKGEAISLWVGPSAVTPVSQGERERPPQACQKREIWWEGALLASVCAPFVLVLRTLPCRFVTS